MGKKDKKPGVDASFLHLDELVVIQRSIDLASKGDPGNAPMRKTRDRARKI